MANRPTLPTFPYRGTDRATIEAIGAAIESVDDLIYKLVRKYLPDSRAELRDEIAQRTRIHLFTKVAPKFDASRAKWSTFCHRCITNFMLQTVRNRRPKTHRTGKKPPSPLEDISRLDLEAPDRTHDRAVERLAEAIFQNPKQYGLTPIQCEVLAAVADAEPSARLKHIGEALGYMHPTSFATVLARLRVKLAALDPDAAADDENLKLLSGSMANLPQVAPLLSTTIRHTRKRKLAVANRGGADAGAAGGDGDSKRAGVPAHGEARAA